MVRQNAIGAISAPDRSAHDRDVHASAQFAAWFFAIGSGMVILGGLIAAVTSPLGLHHGSWLAAYLVLVAGVTQCAIGKAQHLLASSPISRRLWLIQLLGWNLGNTAVVIGTFTGVPAIVDCGGIILLVPMISTLYAVRRTPKRVWAWFYRATIVVVAIGMPIGLVLAHLRAA